MFARTKRLTLRPGWAEDAAAMAQAIAHEAVVMKLSRVPWPYAEADAHDWLMRPRGIDDVHCLIFAHETAKPRLIGAIGLHPGVTSDMHEMGYWLTPDAWGRGYATEAGRAMLDIADRSLGLRRLAAGHFVDNPASGRVLHKLGFRPTGIIEPQFSRARGAKTDCVKLVRDLDADEPGHSMPMAA